LQYIGATDAYKSYSTGPALAEEGTTDRARIGRGISDGLVRIVVCRGSSRSDGLIRIVVCRSGSRSDRLVRIVVRRGGSRSDGLVRRIVVCRGSSFKIVLARIGMRV
jgi:hypothetical protein